MNILGAIGGAIAAHPYIAAGVGVAGAVAVDRLVRGPACPPSIVSDVATVAAVSLVGYAGIRAGMAGTGLAAMVAGGSLRENPSRAAFVTRHGTLAVKEACVDRGTAGQTLANKRWQGDSGGTGCPPRSAARVLGASSWRSASAFTPARAKALAGARRELARSR